MICCSFCVFFFKQKTAYEMRISDWSSDVCSSDLTANLLLSLAFPRAKQRQEMVFSAIEDALVHGEIDLGLIIHENRFTYEKKGLQKVMDLGEYWEKETGCPIPLGGIMVKRALRPEIKEKVNRLTRRSKIGRAHV